MSIKNYIKNVPCIPTALINNKTLYLLDDDKNIVFCNENNFTSIDFESIKKNFNNNIKPETYTKTTSFIHNCKGKEVEFFDLTKKPELFLAPEVIINDNILNKYNLSDINLNIFEKTRLFNYYIKSFNLELYKKLNDKDKTRLIFILYYNYCFGDIFFMSDLENKLLIEKQKPNFNNNDFIKQYYKDNTLKIQDSIIVLTEFKDIFNIIVPKKEEIVIKKEEPKKGLDGGAIAGIVIGSLVIIGLFGLFLYYRKSTAKKAALALASASASASAATLSSTTTPAVTGHIGHIGHAGHKGHTGHARVIGLHVGTA